MGLNEQAKNCMCFFLAPLKDNPGFVFLHPKKKREWMIAIATLNIENKDSQKHPYQFSN